MGVVGVSALGFCRNITKVYNGELHVPAPIGDVKVLF